MDECATCEEVNDVCGRCRERLDESTAALRSAGDAVEALADARGSRIRRNVMLDISELLHWYAREGGGNFDAALSDMAQDREQEQEREMMQKRALSWDDGDDALDHTMS